ncbi:hypothetical protein [Secundilactobacillus yichangensis]|uniref:hypothetical protein n=1 Tax=Secundilactobacillus yichangensis TaxID=2799580 RepID=UPI0019446BF0|nr:hypothetical protein [Secundilactobacillus yichangensis]
MKSIYMLPVHGSELDRTFSLTVDGIIQTFYVPQNTLSKLPLKLNLTDVDNNDIQYGTAYSFT